MSKQIDNDADQGVPLEPIVRHFFHREVMVWKEDDWSPFPWRFSVRDTTGVLHEYSGIPNKCETSHAALMRGWYRAKWMHLSRAIPDDSLTPNA